MPKIELSGSRPPTSPGNDPTSNRRSVLEVVRSARHDCQTQHLKR
jgi:hypothetical protein